MSCNPPGVRLEMLPLCAACGKRLGLHRWETQQCPNPQWKPASGRREWLGETFRARESTRTTTTGGKGMDMAMDWMAMATVESREPRRHRIDFHRVLPQHAEIHVRLQNWGRWCNGTGAPAVSPMFRLYRAPARSRGAEASWSQSSVNGTDAQRIARFMVVIPEPQRRALAWCYVKPVSPKRAAADLGVSLDHLACLVHEGREQLCILRA